MVTVVDTSRKVPVLAPDLGDNDHEQEQMQMESSVVASGPFSKEMALALGLPSGSVDILRHRSVQRDAMPDWKLFQLFDVPPDPRNFKARLSYTKMDRQQSAHMNALHRLVYGKPAEECGRKVCKEYARAYAIEIFFPCAMRLDWAQFAVDKRGKKWQKRQPLVPFSPHLPGGGISKQLLEEPEEMRLSQSNCKRNIMVDSREWKLENAKMLLGFQSTSAGIPTQT